MAHFVSRIPGVEIARGIKVAFSILCISQRIVFYPPLGVPLWKTCLLFVLFAIVLAVNASESERLWVGIIMGSGTFMCA